MFIFPSIYQMGVVGTHFEKMFGVVGTARLTVGAIGRQLIRD